TLLLISLSLMQISAEEYAGLKPGHKYDFKETKVLPKLKKSTERTGTMVYVAPDGLSMDYTEPAGDYTHITATSFDVCKKGNVTHFPISDPKNRMSVFRATLLYCLGGEVEKAAVLNNATITNSKSAEKRICTLTAEKASSRDISKIELCYDVKSNRLLSMTITEGNSNYTIYELQ
nr:outer membrane lipoprotein carrier protein LolA [Paludibacteraceae bacterium]